MLKCSSVNCPAPRFLMIAFILQIKKDTYNFGIMVCPSVFTRKSNNSEHRHNNALSSLHLIALTCSGLVLVDFLKTYIVIKKLSLFFKLEDKMLSKYFVLTKCDYMRVSLFSVVRQAQQVHTQSAVEKARGAKPEELENPNIFQKIVLRFKGIPLKGEPHRPSSLFDDVGKYYLYEPLPKVPKDYKEFPERDLVNYPYPSKAEYPPRTRFVAIPDSWCREIEKVSGTSGPYLFFGGLLALLLNKEIIIMEENFCFFVFGWVNLYLFFHTAFRYKLEKYFYNTSRERFGKMKAYIDNELKEAVSFRKTSKEQADSLKAVHENFPTIFQENLALQLEATYRKNVDYAWQELKRRLDYLQEVQATKDRFIKEMMVKLITEGVRKQIETNENGIRDKYLDQCIDQLRVLAPN